MLSRRLPRPALAAVTALALLLLAAQPVGAAPLLAHTGGSDRLMVIVWTLAAVIGALLLTILGYVFRRALGSDRTPPVTILEPGQPTGRTD